MQYIIAFIIEEHSAILILFIFYLHVSNASMANSWKHDDIVCEITCHLSIISITPNLSILFYYTSIVEFSPYISPR